MAEDLLIKGETKSEKYETLLPQIHALISNETDRIANLANIAAAIKETFGFFWVGFYLVKGDELVLGPFQGPVACTRIKKGRGVCGDSWQQAQTIIVPDVDQYPNHIACSSASKSEIVVPILDSHHQVIGVLDVDHDQLATFDATDAHYLAKIVEWL